MPVITITDASPFITSVYIIIAIPAITINFPQNLLLASHVWSFSILHAVRNPIMEFLFITGM